MFAKQKEIKLLGRLKKRSDFLCVQKAGHKWVAKGIIVEILENQGLGVRYGLTVSKKVSKSAVIRNRVKRRLRAAICDVLPSYAPQDLDVVLIGRVETLERDYKDIKGDLRWCLKKLGIKKVDADASD